MSGVGSQAASSLLVCLDATPILEFHRVGELQLLKTWLPNAIAPLYVMEQEIEAWEHKYPANVEIREGAWPSTIAADADEDALLIAELSKRFPEKGRKNIGEMHVIALTKRFKGTAILEDQQGRLAAIHYGAKSAYMVSMIAAAAANEMLTENEAWDLQRRLETDRERSVIRSNESQKFRNTVRFMKELRPQWNPWPDCLHNNALDRVAIAAAKEELDKWRPRFGLPPRAAAS